jgi:hypothetical protein
MAIFHHMAEDRTWEHSHFPRKATIVSVSSSSSPKHAGARVGLDSSKPDILTVSAAVGIYPCTFLPVFKLKMRLYRTQSFEERRLASLPDWTAQEFRLNSAKNSTASSHMMSPYFMNCSLRFTWYLG